MKKSSVQHTKKAAISKPIIAPKTVSQDVKKKVKLPEKGGPLNVVHKTSKGLTQQPSQKPAELNKTEKKDKINTNKTKVFADFKSRGVENTSAGNFNVTVFSPPSSRKETTCSATKQLNALGIRDRTRTRTLKPGEATLLENVPQITDEYSNNHTKTPSIAFDIHFDKNSISSSFSAKNKTPSNQAELTYDENQYESEFESYESDFEYDSSKKSVASSHKSSSSNSLTASTDSDESYHSNEDNKEVRTVNEQKLDSGNYDIKLKQQILINNHGNILKQKSILNEDQPDSGMHSGMFEHYCISSNTKLLRKRYADILDKISFNTMTFYLHENEPASYEYFTVHYGMVKGVHLQTQTDKIASSCETQTEYVHQKACWIQHPPQFSLCCLSNMETEPAKYAAAKIGVGHESILHRSIISNNKDLFVDFLKNLECSKSRNDSKPPISKINKHYLDILNRFLKKCLEVLEHIFTKNITNCNDASAKMVQLKLQSILNNSTVTSVTYDDKSSQLFLTFYECNQETNCHKYAINVWDTKGYIRHKFVLSCWSNVLCTERIGAIVIAGTADGTLCLWDTTEAKKKISPFQIVCPSENGSNIQSDYGNVITVRLADTKPKSCNTISLQVLTLYEHGFLVIWLLSRIEQERYIDYNQPLNTIFYNSDVGLIQQNILNFTSIQLEPGRLCNSTAENIFPKDSLEDLINSKYNAADDSQADDHRIYNDMIICRNKAIIFSKNQIVITNCFDPKITQLFRMQDFITNIKQHPKYEGFIFMFTLNNTIKVNKLTKQTKCTFTHGVLNQREGKQPSSLSNIKSSPLLSNKSCTIQNIVKNERKLYNEASSFADGLANPISAKIDNYIHDNHRAKWDSELISLHHNQLFYLTPSSHINLRIHFLRQGHLLCVGSGRNAQFFDLKTGQESCLNKYIPTECDSYKWIATTDTHMIMTKTGQDIYLYNMNDDNFKSQ